MTGKIPKAIEPDRELTALAGTPVSVGPVPTEVMIVPWGEVESANGCFTVDEESASLVVQAFEEHGCDLPIDYEHQTLGGPYTSPTGQAPAAGWIKRVHARPGEGLLAEVQWTDPAIEQLEAKQYRYLSPVAIIRKSDRKLVALHSVALTNKPAITGMQPIVNRDVSADAPQEGAGHLRQRLALDPATSDAEVLVAATRRVAQLEEEIRLQRVEERVRAAMADGKLTTAQRSWAVKLCLHDETLFDEWLATAAVVVQPGRLEPPGRRDSMPRTASIAAGARAEYRANPELAAVTSEEAYVADALRQTTAGPVYR